LRRPELASEFKLPQDVLKYQALFFDFPLSSSHASKTSTGEVTEKVFSEEL
jgi:hypothetical protein